jgi:hypothetical protein
MSVFINARACVRVPMCVFLYVFVCVIMHVLACVGCVRVCVPEEERDHVERLRWPSRGYLQELSEYQQRRRKLRKSRCTVM